MIRQIRIGLIPKACGKPVGAAESDGRNDRSVVGHKDPTHARDDRHSASGMKVVGREDVDLRMRRVDAGDVELGDSTAFL